jgi:hypothetical protein
MTEQRHNHQVVKFPIFRRIKRPLKIEILNVSYVVETEFIKHFRNKFQRISFQFIQLFPERPNSSVPLRVAGGHSLTGMLAGQEAAACRENIGL